MCFLTWHKMNSQNYTQKEKSKHEFVGFKTLNFMTQTSNNTISQPKVPKRNLSLPTDFFLFQSTLRLTWKYISPKIYSF